MVKALLTSATYEIAATTPTEISTEPIDPTSASRARSLTMPDIRIRATEARISRQPISAPARGGVRPANAAASKPGTCIPTMASPRLNSPSTAQGTALAPATFNHPAASKRTDAPANSSATAVVGRMGAQPGMKVTRPWIPAA